MPAENMDEAAQCIRELADQHSDFAVRLADRPSVMAPAVDPDFEATELAFPAWAAPGRDAILQPPSERVLELAADRDRAMKAAS